MAFQLQTTVQRMRFSSASIQVVFTDEHGQASDDLQVCSISPRGHIIIDKTAEVTTTTQEAQLEAGIANVGINIGASRTAEFTRSSAAMVMGSYRSTGPGNANEADWQLRENPSLQVGIPSYFEVAILLRRRGQQDTIFSGTVYLELKTSGGSLLNKINDAVQLTVQAPHDDPILFNPALPPYPGDPSADDVDLAYLERVDLSSFAQFRLERQGIAGEDDKSPRIDEGVTKAQKLFYCARGLYDDAWYKFRRFETLSLLNLYHYQDKLVQIENTVTMSEGNLAPEEVEVLGKTLRQYYEAVKLFKEISLMDRPPQTAQVQAAQVLRDELSDSRYISAGELGMVDLTPQTLGVSADPVRLLLKRWHPDQDVDVQPALAERDKKFESTKVPPGRKNPVSEQVSPGLDRVARLLVSIGGGAFLLAPMYALTFIREQRDQLITVGLFVIFFAVVVALASRASNQELIGATAAYAAVLVVFVSQNPSSGS
ncbi:hypothetical protein GQ53DRAFT_754737 [Thozetella sp. PMI_491]|nr:hypothetical protein GQ53DRAFT_754737 [Thozetella sp. PMI_491]